jgi:hypothetical protein
VEEEATTTTPGPEHSASSNCMVKPMCMTTLPQGVRSVRTAAHPCPYEPRSGPAAPPHPHPHRRQPWHPGCRCTATASDPAANRGEEPPPSPRHPSFAGQCLWRRRDRSPRGED